MAEQMKKLVVGNREFEIVDEAARAGIGSPLVASTVAAMTDQTKIYVYTGSETGYTSGNWYYYDGSAWTSGGVYNAVATDDTLSTAGAAADAKAVGDALETKAEIDGMYDNMTVGNAEQLVSNVFSEDKVPYSFRTAGGSIDIGDRETDKIVGGTVAWNQLHGTGNWAMSHSPTSGTRSYDSETESLTFTFTIPSQGYGYLQKYIKTYKDHVYLTSEYIEILSISEGARINSIWCKVSSSTSSPRGYGAYRGADYYQALQKITANGTSFLLGFSGTVGAEVTIKISKSNLFDLTEMFGTTIAEYVNNINQADIDTGIERNPRAGVLWFRKLFPKMFYPYPWIEGTLMSVNAASHDMIGFNAYDNSTGKAKLVGGMPYQITGAYTNLVLNDATITPDEDGYFTPSESGLMNVTGGNATTCIHLVWDGEKDGEYEEYVKRSYPLDSSLTLRGIPMLDANNNLYYDGDTYESDGTVTRKYATVDLSTLSWTTRETGNTNKMLSASLPSASISYGASVNAKWVSDKYRYIKPHAAAGLIQYVDSAAVGIYSYKASSGSSNDTIYLVIPVGDSVSGNLVYELYIPTTETADPFQNLQIVDDFGTEEYVDAAVVAGTRDVSIPVGHVTQYMNNLRAKLEMMPDSPDGNGDYIVRQENGLNEYVPLIIPTELPEAPAEDGTYKLTVTISDGTATYAWVNE